MSVKASNAMAPAPREGREVLAARVEIWSGVEVGSGKWGAGRRAREYILVARRGEERETWA